MQFKTSPERLSIMLGLLVLMLATLPRYLAGGHDDRLTLILLALVVIAGVCAFHFRLLSSEARGHLPALMQRFGVCLGVGLVVMGIWHSLFSDWISWQVLLSHGATLGLLIHVLWLRRYPASR